MIDRISDKDNTLEHDGYRYRKILNDFEFELALSSKSLGYRSTRNNFYSYDELEEWNWVESTFRTAKSNGAILEMWTPYICIGKVTDEPNH